MPGSAGSSASSAGWMPPGRRRPCRPGARRRSWSSRLLRAEPAPALERGAGAAACRSAALTLAGVLIGTFAVLPASRVGRTSPTSFPARDDRTVTAPTTRPAQGAARRRGATTPETTTTAPTISTRSRPPAASSAPATAWSVADTSVGETRPRPKPPASTPAPAPATRPTTTAAAGLQARATGRGRRCRRRLLQRRVHARRPDLLPSGADRTAPDPAELGRLSAGVRTRWIVRAGFGAPSAKRLGAPIVNSGFTVS